MQAELLNPDQLLAAAEDARVKISSLPAIKPENSEGILGALNSRFDFLELVDGYGRVPQDQLGGKLPRDKLKEEGLSAPAASSIYEVVMIASYPKERTNLPEKFQADIPAMMETIPPFLRRLSLGGELQTLLAPQYRLDIDTLVAQGPETVRAEYDRTVDRLNEVSRQKNLQPDQRLSVAGDVISLLTLVSHPQTQNIVRDITISPDPSQPVQKPLPLSSIAASLTTYHLGEEMEKMLKPVQETVPKPQPEQVPLAQLIENILAGKDTNLNEFHIDAYSAGFGTPQTQDFGMHIEQKGHALPGESHIEKFRSLFAQPAENTLKDLRTPENIAKQKAFLARIELMLLNAIRGKSRDALFDHLAGTTGYSRQQVEESVNLYDSRMERSNKNQRDIKEVIIQSGNISYKPADILTALTAQLAKEPKRAFGIPKYLIGQYSRNPDGKEKLLRFIAAMNELAANPQTQQRIGFMEIF